MFKTPRIWASISFALALAATAAVVSSDELVRMNGMARLTPPALFPLFVAGYAAVLDARWARIVAAVLLCLFSLAGGMTIGFFYIPAALAMVAASCC